jgi:hypothetical protein
MNMVDDATGKTLGRLGEQETIWAAASVLRRWIEKYGVPLALYTYWKNVYLREPTAKEEMRGEVPVTQLGRMCHKLNIRIIGANSAQAKGRVERNHGTHQDRLVKKMRRKNIGTHEQANEYLEREYLLEHNHERSILPVPREHGLFVRTVSPLLRAMQPMVLHFHDRSAPANHAAFQPSSRARSQNFLSPDVQDAEADGESVASFTAHTCMWQMPTNGLVTCTRSMTSPPFRFFSEPQITQSNPAKGARRHPPLIPTRLQHVCTSIR